MVVLPLLVGFGLRILRLGCMVVLSFVGLLLVYCLVLVVGWVFSMLAGCVLL